MPYEDTKAVEFTAIRLKLASPEVIHGWSFGEVTKPETINYRTQKPEKSGLFAEEIFGPSKDWECYCGKYKRIRYKGIVCDKCGVEVTRAVVRRERMGHIDLAAPVSHIWFLRGVPSKIGMMLGLSVQELEKVIYFASFVVTNVDEQLRAETLKQIDSEFQQKRKSIEAETNQSANELKQKKAHDVVAAKPEKAADVEKRFDEELQNLTVLKDEKLKTLEAAVNLAKKELKDLKKYDIISENMYHDLSLKYGHVFEAGIGAETILHLLREIDLAKTAEVLEKEVEEAPLNKKRRLVRRLKLVKNFILNGLRPEWMIMTTIPIIPPDLRPMVQLDGGRFATSDLNDLYRRVINRNNRLKRLIELNAPEVICRNEKRMLQEAVDALIDNGARHGKTVTASTGQKRMLKSIADMLKGKQGRFRQNLLGKRVDYSGRSVIVVGPHLKLNQCGLPKTMALELFRPFVIAELIKREYVHNVRSASRFIESGRDEVWDILEEITKKSTVLLNRAPTLHRLGIQAFQPLLIEGKAIQIHPLVCSAFNADFDGDQMAVHVPLTENAKREAMEIMLSSKNLLKPATGSPVVTPHQDIVLGSFYLTTVLAPAEKLKTYGSMDEVLLAHSQGFLKMQEQLRVRMNGELVQTTVGRIIFNNAIPEKLRFVNDVMTRKALSELVARCIRELGAETTVEFVDSLKKTGFEYLTQSGISWGMDDLPTPKEKPKILAAADARVEEIQQHFDTGLLTVEERHAKIVEVWVQTRDEVQKISRKTLDPLGSVYAMIESGARGSLAQLSQMMGMKGPVANPSGDTIELPIKGSYKEGFDVLEYFIATHGTRKGLADTALRTANAGYLTRRLIDVSQDVVVTEADCGTKNGITFTKEESEEFGESLAKRVIGRTSLQKVMKPRAKKPLIDENDLIHQTVLEELEKLDLPSFTVRSVLTCDSRRGVCQKCYGYDLGFNRLVSLGTAIGIIAAQSIGEPGTQLTMRTFHTGGVAGQDITQGLPRVEELFEARSVRRPAVLSDVAGKVTVLEQGRQKTVQIAYHDSTSEVYDLLELAGKAEVDFKVTDGQKIEKGEALFVIESETTKAKSAGTIHLKGKKVTVAHEKEQMKEFQIPIGMSVWAKTGDLVAAGTQLTDGSPELQELYLLSGIDAVQKYILKEIQYIYSSQGQKLNDKHIEMIVRGMFSRVTIEDSGGTDFLSGEMVSVDQFNEANDVLRKAGKREATCTRLLLGITKASLSTESFLSAASFIETARVLIDAAVSGKVDHLRGLKENVIIGKLIPAGTGFGIQSVPVTEETT